MQSKIERPGDYRAGLYIRLSKEDENEGPSESVSNQKSLLETFAKEQGLEVSGVYIDDGWSGTSFARPDFQRLLGDIEAKKINMVITKDLSRLGRDYIMTGYYLERYFPEKRIRYLSLLDGIDTGTETTANEMTPFRAIMNDMYAKDISKKIKSVKRDKQRRGLFIGGKAVYGYKLHPTEKNKILVDEPAAKIVRQVFALGAKGLSCRKIAEILNTDGVSTPAVYAGLKQGGTGPYTGLWSGERISEMLQNETYIGSMVQGRRARVSYKSQKCQTLPKENWVVVENTHEPLVDRTLFEQVQRLLESRRSTRCRSYDFPLKGLIFCQDCGYPMAVINRKKKDGGDCLYFVCRTYQRFTKAGACTSHTIKEETLSHAAREKLRELCEKQLSFEKLAHIAEKAVRKADEASQTKEEMNSLTAKIRGLTAHLDQVYMDKLNGLLAEEDFARLYQKVKDERVALEQRLARLTAGAKKPLDYKERARALTERFLSTAAENRELLISLVSRLEYSEDRRLEIHFRCRGPEGLL